MGQRERTAEDRAERINVLQILISGVVGDATKDGVTPDRLVCIHLETTLQTLNDLLDELREAKLARARLELKRAQL